MLPVDFKKWPCRPAEFKGQGPHRSSQGCSEQERRVDRHRGVQNRREG